MDYMDYMDGRLFKAICEDLLMTREQKSLINREVNKMTQKLAVEVAALMKAKYAAGVAGTVDISAKFVGGALVTDVRWVDEVQF